jgi:hypothetical protein
MQQEIQAVHGAYEYVRDGGIIGCLVFFIVGGFRQWWVFGYVLTRERLMLEQQRDQLFKEREEWKSLALRATATADKAVDHAALLQKVG